QLWDALDPKHPGPKIRGGLRSKARSPEHLEEVCQAVMADAPRDRDKAVVFVLSRLLEPPKGPTVSEKHKAQSDATTMLEEAYHREAKRVGVAWARDNPEKYKPIREQVRAHFRDAPTGTFTDFAVE